MKWNGTVSHDCQMTMPTRFATANAPQAISSRVSLSVRKPVPRVADGLDRRLRPELLAQPADAHLDDVRARVEVVAPHLGEQALAADDLAWVEREVVEEAELAIRQISRAVLQVRPPPREVEGQPADADDARVTRDAAAKVRADAGDQLVEREGLRNVVVRPEGEAAQL